MNDAQGSFSSSGSRARRSNRRSMGLSSDPNCDVQHAKSADSKNILKPESNDKMISSREERAAKRRRLIVENQGVQELPRKKSKKPKTKDSEPETSGLGGEEQKPDENVPNTTGETVTKEKTATDEIIRDKSVSSNSGVEDEQTEDALKQEDSLKDLSSSTGSKISHQEVSKDEMNSTNDEIPTISHDTPDSPRQIPCNDLNKDPKEEKKFPETTETNASSTENQTSQTDAQ